MACYAWRVLADHLAILAEPALRSGCRVVATGMASVAEHLDLRAGGIADVTFVDAARAPDLIARYHALNRARFDGPLALPGWVLADLYLMPAAITLLMRDDAIVAAYYAAPTLAPGEVVGVSLLSAREGQGLGTAAKALGLAVLRARVARGVTQWESRALPVHARFGDLQVEGPAPAVHGLADTTFCYRCVLGRVGAAPAHAVPVDVARARAARGERLVLAAGVRGPPGHVVVREGGACA
jgi:hypothetical protein